MFQLREGFASARAQSFRSSHSSPLRERVSIAAQSERTYDVGTTRVASPSLPSAAGSGGGRRRGTARIHSPRRPPPNHGALGDALQRLSRQVASPESSPRQRGDDRTARAMRLAEMARPDTGGQQRQQQQRSPQHAPIKTTSAKYNTHREDARRKEQALRDAEAAVRMTSPEQRREHSKVMGVRMGKLARTGSSANVRRPSITLSITLSFSLPAICIY
eukprot:COSAG06_NODE_3395_length_5406_cov_3.434520_7_plen_218_part_00